MIIDRKWNAVALLVPSGTAFKVPPIGREICRHGWFIRSCRLHRRGGSCRGKQGEIGGRGA